MFVILVWMDILLCAALCYAADFDTLHFLLQVRVRISWWTVSCI